MDAAERTQWVVAQARAVGFDLCGVAPAEPFAELARMPEWLERGYAGEMNYLRDARRLDPRSVLPGMRSIIVCALNYNTELPYSTEVPDVRAYRCTPLQPAAPGTGCHSERSGESAFRVPDSPGGWISRYAWGDDYHKVLGVKLEALLAAMRGHFAEPFDARVYVDTGPIVERVAARHAGLGWLAKNTCLINEQLGSWLFLGVVITTLELAPSLTLTENETDVAGVKPAATVALPPPDLCGNCRQCIDSCPTGAIVEPYVLDARRCISYLTIELRGSIPEGLRAPMGRMVFGCDICQDVCPFNRKAPPTREPRFEPRVVGAQHAAPAHDSLFAPSLEFLVSLTEDDFRRIFRGSAVKRTKWRGLVRNVCVALGNVLAGQAPVLSKVEGSAPVYARAVTLLNRLAQSSDPLIAEHAQWALQRIRSGLFHGGR